MAGNKVPVLDFAQRGRFLPAAVTCHAAAAVKAAAGRRIDGAWNVPFQLDALPAFFNIRIRNRDCRQKRLCIGMHWLVIERF